VRSGAEWCICVVESGFKYWDGCERVRLGAGSCWMAERARGGTRMLLEDSGGLGRHVLMIWGC
jgi:hypothetical protein